MQGDLLFRFGTLVFFFALVVLLAWATRRASPASGGWRVHLEDLRRRIMVSAVALLVAVLVLFSFRAEGYRLVPSVQHNMAAQAFGRMTADLVPPDVQLVVVRPIDGFMAELTIAFGLGALLAMPVIVTQMAGFVGPALKEKEKRFLRAAAIPIVLLFVAGATFAYVFVLPFLLETLYGYGSALGAQPLLQVSELVSFAVGLMVIMGIAFQLPLVMFALSRIGLVEPRTWARLWRHALVVILLASAVITDPTIVSQLMVAAPLMVLYGLGVAAAYVRPASR